MSKPSGYGIIQIGGQERPFHVGTNQGDHFCRLRNISLMEYGELFSPQNLQDKKLKGGDIADFVYSALVAGAEWDGLRVEFNHIHVRSWFDSPDADSNELTKPLTEMFNQMKTRIEREVERAGNAVAPQKEMRGSKATGKKATTKKPKA